MNRDSLFDCSAVSHLYLCSSVNTLDHLVPFHRDHQDEWTVIHLFAWVSVCVCVVCENVEHNPCRRGTNRQSIKSNGIQEMNKLASVFVFLSALDSSFSATLRLTFVVLRWNVSTSVEWIAVKFGSHIHVPLRTFPSASAVCLRTNISRRTRWSKNVKTVYQ